MTRRTPEESHHHVGGTVERDRLVRFLRSLRRRHADNLFHPDPSGRAQAQMAVGLLDGLIAEAKAGAFDALRPGQVWKTP